MPPKQKNSKSSVSENLRRAVLESGRPLSQVASETGIDLGNLSRFVRGQRWLSVENIDRLCEHLGLVLVRPGGSGKLKCTARLLALAGAVAASQLEPSPVNDAMAALISVGHTQGEAQQLIAKATAEKQCGSAGEILAAVYRSGAGTRNRT